MADQYGGNPTAAGWVADPEGRHQYRYWDGAAWTDYVADDGQQSLAPLAAQTESIEHQLVEAGPDTDLPEFTSVEGIVSPAEAVDVLFDRALPATPDVTVEEARRTYEFVRATWGSQALYSGTPGEMRQLILTNLQRMHAEDGFRSFRIEVNADENHLRAMVVVFSGDGFQPVGVYRSGDAVLVCGNFTFTGPSEPVPPI